MRYLLVKEAHELIYNYAQKLFKEKIPEFKSLHLDASCADEARNALLALSKNPNMGIEYLPLGIQRDTFTNTSPGLLSNYCFSTLISRYLN